VSERARRPQSRWVTIDRTRHTTISRSRSVLLPPPRLVLELFCTCYVSDAGRYAEEFGKSANTWGKNQFGVDVAERVTTTVRGIGGGPEGQGYGSVPTQSPGEASGLYQEDDDLFKEYRDTSPATTSYNSPLPTGNTSSTSISAVKHTAPKKDDWDDWKDF